jgi:hypothetical protein
VRLTGNAPKELNSVQVRGIFNKFSRNLNILNYTYQNRLYRLIKSQYLFAKNSLEVSKPPEVIYGSQEKAIDDHRHRNGKVGQTGNSGLGRNWIHAYFIC